MNHQDSATPGLLFVEWVDDGFLHSVKQVPSEFVDVDEFVRIPAIGLVATVQFARLRVSLSPAEPFREHVVIGSEGLPEQGAGSDP